ncbi:hypothetical protein ANN_25766 [Periplaneta americana]|uniref:Transposase n=1 Tax=Periplaneta americana TaxID=6978 RepID=A0ABQ8S425_PERAM|nr:hypothetical protein ANN_25766 [Periplaneta americana]
MTPAASVYGDGLLEDGGGGGGGDNQLDLEMEQQLLEQRLRQQQRESEEDGRWLAEEETNLKKRLSIATSVSDRSDTDSVDGSPLHHGGSAPTPPPLSSATPPSTICRTSSQHDSSERDRSSTPLSNGSAEERVIVVKKMEPTPTADLDRSNDKVYDCTTSVVKAVMSLSQGVQQSRADQYLELVRRVGMELRALLSSVDTLVPVFPISAHRESPLCILCYFKMNDVIDNPADCEVRSVIRFLNALHLKPAEIYRQLKEVYGDTVMNERNVRKWCEMFNNGRTNVHDETRPGRPSLITEDLKTKVNDRILQDRRTSLDELHIAFPDISRSLLGEIVSQHLGYHKICARWVPRQLSDQHKTQRMASALTFLMRYHTDGDAFLDQIVTGDETWVSHNTPETKCQSRQWHHPSSPKKPRKFKQTLSTQKVMATVFWDRKGVLLLDFMPKGTTINANRYCETLRKLRRAFQNKRRGKLSRGVVLLHDNARPHTAASTRELLDQFGWEIFDHPPYSPDLAPSDFH